MDNHILESKNFENLSDRLNYVLEVLGTKKADLARAINVQPQTIQYLCSGNTNSSKFTFEIAAVLGINTGWLATGKGEIFLADDPKQKLLKDYKKIPFLNSEQLILKAKSQTIKEADIKIWAVLKTVHSNVFCVAMNDSSMEPMLPNSSSIFFKEKLLVDQKNPIDSEIVVAYSKRQNTVMVREIIEIDNLFYLFPINKELFKEISFNEDFIILGNAIECQFTIERK
jgi:SOS-response transcriptional repressor LexA